ncbi:rhodanese-like domain-containing protein [Geothermobacter hydrogeniphilus]|uniref:Rhodanese-like domain-containing protein n=1 Tax=Geothermobacter hydrogeniphilus TaxID=1969733 RepID=A0A2K2HCC2_9BACT|nr:rhodanese-like domain-containing protein [Geothermobacter hydrogeniphilus]PNU20891.1 rhodanese-like domain-containing protein [Geothermobacter hydrogeniphilus]
MKPEDLAKQLGRADAPLVVDVRSGFEYRGGHIPGALHMPFWRLPVDCGKLPDRNRALVLTCEHGPRAQLALGFLRMRGFSRIELLDGHMHRWRGRKLPLEKGG